MANWWDNGLQGDFAWHSSQGVEQPVPGYDYTNLTGGSTIGSFSLNTNAETGSYYDILLNTFSLGTQLYMRLSPVDAGHITVYDYQFDPAEIYMRRHNVTYYIKQGSTTRWLDHGGAGTALTYAYDYSTPPSSGFINLDSYMFSVYYCNYLLTRGAPEKNPIYAYPRGGSGAVNTNQLACVATNDGLDIYMIGMPCQVTVGDTTYLLSTPCAWTTRIPASMLNDPQLFNPNDDAATPDIDPGGGADSDFNVDYDYPGDDIDFPSLPSGASALGFGKMHIFHPSATQLGNALDILWYDTTESTVETILESIKKWLYKPEQYCVGIMLMPINVTGTSTRIYFGKYDTEVDAPAISSQWQIVDCGSVSVPLKSNSAFDFAPYTKAMIFLPYVGFRSINVGEIMGGTIYVKYYVDMFTGAALCMVKISNPNSNNSVMYTYECNIGLQIPITSENYNGVIDTLLRTGVALLSTPISAGPATAKLAGMAASTVPAMPSPDIQTSGQLSSNTGVLANPKPYVVLHFPVQSVPSGFSSQNGFPSAANVQLGTLSGYTEVEQIHLDISGATSDELSEIETMLKNGVIL